MKIDQIIDCKNDRANFIKFPLQNLKCSLFFKAKTDHNGNKALSLSDDIFHNDNLAGFYV